MRVARDGKSIMASEISCEVSTEGHHEAINVGRYISDGFKRVIAREIGLEITDAEVWRGGLNVKTLNIIITASSSWVPPTRR
jgi:hypothetical protein